MRHYGFSDRALVPEDTRPLWQKLLAFSFGLLIIVAFWYALNQKLLLGDDWLSQTYDNEEWKTNEGDLSTFGAWDIETHIWKTDVLLENFPHYEWSEEWYMGMPLYEYYQLGFYFVNIGMMYLADVNSARASILIIVYGHLFAVLLTYLFCYKLSKRFFASALCSIFLLANTFLTLRSYGWEPITVVFLFLFPLGLLVFFHNPLKPFRFWMIIVLGVSYLSHPLIWFSLCMTMGLYLFSIGIRKTAKSTQGVPYLWQYIALVFGSIAVGAIQFIPQFAYHQVSSGAHMGVSYLPFYQVAPNIIKITDFLFDAGNLKGPGPIIMIALLLIIIYWAKQAFTKGQKKNEFISHEIISGLSFVLAFMVFFYYIEAWNLFPMNILRSIQYHRIIPEFIIIAAGLVAAMSTITKTPKMKIMYYSLLIGFVLASSILIYNVQEKWETVDQISDRPEFIYDEFEGRISFPYTDQSLSVRSSFNNIPQVYGYYEQGITNSFADDMMSVSSGFHNANLTTLYLQSANVARLYVNMEEGKRDELVRKRLNQSLEFVDTGSRYAYFVIPLKNPSLVQPIEQVHVESVKEYEIGCRVIFHEEYCGSESEEFVSTDTAEKNYLRTYVQALDQPTNVTTSYEKQNPEEYHISVFDATRDTNVIVKMTYNKNFKATVGGEQVPIEAFGPDYMLISPKREGNYGIVLKYHTSMARRAGTIISVVSIIGFAILFLARIQFRRLKMFEYPKGDMEK